MCNLILTSYLENNQLKTKIVKDSEAFWVELINKFKQQCGPKTKQTTIDKWKNLEELSFAERVLEHTTYWSLAKKHNLNPKTSVQDHHKTLALTQKLDLYERVKIVQHLF